MRVVRLGDHVARVTKWNPAALTNGTFEYLDVGSVDRVSKAIAGSNRLRVSDAPSRARQLLAAGDVLVSTVRPNLNAVAYVDIAFDGAIASTGFAVLRPTSELDGRYLFHWVRTPVFIRDMTDRATGASYPAVSDQIVKSSAIPLPSLEEQRRIAAILDQADRQRASLRRLVREFSLLRASKFDELFGAHSGTSTVPLRKLGVSFQSGSSRAAIESDAHVENSVIKVSAVSSGVFRNSETKPLPSDYSPPPEHRIAEGDLLFARASGSIDLVGAVAIARNVPKNVFLPDKVWRAKLSPTSDVSIRFLEVMFRTTRSRSYLQHNASGAAGVRNISQSHVLSMPVPLPKVADLQRFEDVCENLESIQNSAASALTDADTLFASLQSRAFRGEL